MNATLTKDGERFTLRFERRFSHSAADVWRVLTERELMRQWFPCDVEGGWEPGAALKFTFFHGEGDGLPDAHRDGEVIAVDEPRLLEFRWWINDYHIELDGNDDGCGLVFCDSFEDGTEAARTAVGWDFCLANFEYLLNGDDVVSFDSSTWDKEQSVYAAKFEAVGGPQQGMPN